jgi:hypothetical protein
MPKYIVEGADRGTGQDRVISVESPDQETARSEAQRQGVVVSVVRLPDEDDDMAALASAMSSKLYRATQPAPTVSYRTPGAANDSSRKYFGLVIAGWTLRVIGALEVLIGLLSVVVNIPFASQTSSPASFWFSISSGMLSTVVWGVIVFALGEIVLIFRDFARKHLHNQSQ